MKLDYKNWIPDSLLLGAGAGTALFGTVFAVLQMTDSGKGTLGKVLKTAAGGLTLAGAATEIYSIAAYRAFSYHGKKQLSRHIIEGTAQYIDLPDGGRGLDIGCGSGALTIACAKRNPKASMMGLDRWGKEYAAFSRNLCEKNADIEGVAEQTDFVKGDACHLDFEDETFDAVTSNYCYHNITFRNKQELLRETLRVLKKGGTFAIHDIFTRSRYGDMEAFMEQLREEGYESVRLIDTTNRFMDRKTAKLLGLEGSALLTGKK